MGDGDGRWVLGRRELPLVVLEDAVLAEVVGSCRGGEGGGGLRGAWGMGGRGRWVGEGRSGGGSPSDRLAGGGRVAMSSLKATRRWGTVSQSGSGHFPLE